MIDPASAEIAFAAKATCNRHMAASRAIACALYAAANYEKIKGIGGGPR